MSRPSGIVPRREHNVALMRNIERQAMIDPLRYDPLKYTGDAFEFFVELFLMLHPSDNRVGVYDYHPTQENDNGVDGIGVNIRVRSPWYRINIEPIHRDS